MTTDVLIGETEYFPGLGPVSFEGPGSDNPLAFAWYDAEMIVGGRALRDHLRFSIAYWHSLVGGGQDPFGASTRPMAWNEASDPMRAARDRLDAAFELITKLGVPFYCFHDRDLAPEGGSVDESADRLAEMVELARGKQDASGVRLLWGTANLFSHPRYMNGAATNPDFQVLAYAAAQVKAALDATVALGGENYVFWGGREGYFSLLNTDMERELDHLAGFLRRARDYGRSIGFEGAYLIEPKPMEPTKHQYDFDVATVIAFLRQHDLTDDFKLNIENNHATLAGHTFAHEVEIAGSAGLLGSLDVNQGDPQNGWDTDEFLHDLRDTVEMCLALMRHGGLGSGGMNFDAKIRRSSTDPEDIFIAHIHSMDTIARAFIVASRILEESDFLELRRERYASYDSGAGARYQAGELDLADLARLAGELGEPPLKSGQQERYEQLLSRYLTR
ncbi:MAG: xylose isomerase [Gemmatimonadota bacterium]|nr:xylose isomerase [Gemmatimonadota bacterium]